MATFKKLYDILEEPCQNFSSEEEDDIKTKPNPVYSENLLISIIGDEDTCVGFLLGGIGQVTEDQRCNYFVVNRQTKIAEIETAFKSFSERPDIGMILITKEAADRIHPTISKYKQTVPAVMQIPGIYGPYELDTEGNLLRAKKDSQSPATPQKRIPNEDQL
ncbi:hypothetical protein NQ315_013910 [Exocentrus adspersus]|uniref:V-type proton ATPase subunit F n=1 Tax=Exocentrus adspersus TaxID=1586481 RepID=A0AAV8VSL0_9CUCU|nr:hypothetical protein NQ315_013910 [Exocentrus adspersus]